MTGERFHLFWKGLIFQLICFSVLSCGGLSIPIKDYYVSWRAEQKLEAGIRWGQKRHYDRAEAAFQEALHYHSDFVDALLELGDLYLTIEDYDRALKAYQQALNVDHKAYQARAGIWATMLEQSGFAQDVREKVSKEVEDYINQLPEQDNQAEYLHSAYLGLLFLHDEDRRWEVMEKIVLLQPDEERLRSLASDASGDILGEENIQNRLEKIEKYYLLFPPSRHTTLVHRIHLKILAEDIQDLEQLRQEGEKWLLAEPNNRIAYASVGYWFTEKEIDLGRALDLLRTALELLKNPDPEDKPENYSESAWKKALQRTKGYYLDTLGWTFYKLGDLEQARVNLKKASEILDYDDALFYHLGALYEQEGKRDEAIEAYRRSLEAGESLEEVRPALQRLLEESGFAQQDLNRYFAQREGVTTFTDVTERAGLEGVRGMRVAWGDYNGDGYQDLLVDGGRLFQNKGDGTFTDVTETAGLKGRFGSTGGVWADFNNDGYLDFYMMARGYGFPGRFWRNNGDGTFADVTSTAVNLPNDYPTEGAAWGDYNGDGWVDLYLANYEKPISRAIGYGRGTPDVLWVNNRDGSFTDVTKAAGIITIEKMNGRGVNWGDFNNDGLQDIFVSNYRLDPNFLWKNNGDGTFTNVAEKQGVSGDEKKGNYGHTIGSEWGDYDNDGDLDLFSANLAHPRFLGISDKSMLLENTGPPHYRFKNRTEDAGIRYQETHSDPSFADYDNDGDLDLYITAVYKDRQSALYRNDGQGRFVDVTWLAGARVFNGWGSAFADFDRDGDLDLVVGSRDGIKLFANDGNQNSWLQVQVAPKSCNRDGIGSRVTVSSPGLQQIREVQGGKGTGTQHSLPVEFGFGDYHGPVELEIRTSCGQVLKKAGVSLNRMITVED
jgi:tetratricopeptide (TPR) repeat protein